MTGINDDVVLDCSGLTKRFGTVTALDRVDFTLRRGDLFPQALCLSGLCRPVQVNR